MGRTDGMAPSAVGDVGEENRKRFRVMAFEWGGTTSIKALASESPIPPYKFFQFRLIVRRKRNLF